VGGATAERTAADARRAGYRTALETAAEQGRMLPGELDPQLEALMALPAEGADKLLGAIRTRPPMLGRMARQPLVIGEGASAAEVETLMLGDAVEPGQIPRYEAERFAEAIRAAGGADAAKDPAKMMAALNATGQVPWDTGRQAN